MNFMNIPKDYSKKNSKFQIYPISYEGNVTWGKGASNGPKEIIKASHNLEYYDEELNVEPFLKGIYTHKILNLKNKSPEDAIKSISKIQPINFPIFLGGDHATTIGTIKAMESSHEDFDVIIFDAHADCFHSWNGSTNNHRCTTMRASKNHKVGLIGIRSMDKDEADIIKASKSIHMLKSYETTKSNLNKLLKKLNKNIFISIDVDVFDPSFIRNTGTPEPGGFTWNQLLSLIKTISQKKEIIGADIVEFSPKINFESESYALAKLAHKLMAYNLK